MCVSACVTGLKFTYERTSVRVFVCAFVLACIPEYELPYVSAYVGEILVRVCLSACVRYFVLACERE